MSKTSRGGGAIGSDVTLQLVGGLYQLLMPDYSRRSRQFSVVLGWVEVMSRFFKGGFLLNLGEGGNEEKCPKMVLNGLKQYYEGGSTNFTVFL